ncbi:MAG TPA: DUF5683 domain-containing protein [Chitinophagaceae bacterium]|nr:DUF5683 domain-containing protein [Chitinophagaceae bacterium]
MLNKKLFFCTLLLSIFFCSNIFAQQQTDSTKSKMQDSTSKKNILSLDTSAQKYNPKVATFRSAVLPGWGQAYNKKYWKIPIIYGALGITAGIFKYNLKTYKILRQAIILRSDNDPGNDTLVDPQFVNFSTESIRSYRNSFRQNVDYSVLFFIIFWGLNVVDATVDAHLKSFDVSDNISLRIKPGYNLNTNTGGISLVFSFKDKR